MKLFFKHAFHPTVLFEAMRLRGADGAPPTAERYVAAQGFIRPRDGRRAVTFYDLLGRKCDPRLCPKTVQEAAEAWLRGAVVSNVLKFGPVAGNIGKPQPAA